MREPCRERYPIASRRLAILFECIAIYLAHWLVFRYGFERGYIPIGVDGYFHHAIASLLSLENIAQDIDFLPYSYMGERAADHEWLFHWLIKPFTLLGESSQYAITNAAIAWGALLPAMLNWVFRLARVPFAPLIAIMGVWCLYALPERYLMLRAQNLGVFLVISCQLLASHRKYLTLGILVFLFNQAYQGVVLLALVVAASLIAEFAISRSIDRKLLSYTAMALGISLIISPWFPGNVELFVFHIMFKLDNLLSLPELMGTEWGRLTVLDYLRLAYFSVFCLAGALLALWINRDRIGDDYRSRVTIAATVLGLFFSYMSIRHVRFLEMLGPISALALGVSFLLWENRFEKARRYWLLCLLCLLGVCLARYSTTEQKAREPADFYRAHCEYIKTTAAEGELVFNFDWTAFPKLFKCNPQLRYISGLDGYLLAYGDTEVFNQWYMLNSRQYEKFDVGAFDTMIDRVGARLLFFQAREKPTVEFLLGRSGRAQVVVDDAAGILVHYAQ